jgi:magnesium transporter
VDSIEWSGLKWININPVGMKEVEYLKENFNFHPLDLDDTRSRKQRPKIDEYPDYLFFVLHFPRFQKKDRVITASQIAVFIGDNFLITLHSGELKPLEKFFKQCQVESQTRDEYFSYGSGYLFYRVLDRMVDYLFPILDKTLEAMESVEDSVFDETVSNAKEIAVLRRSIIAQRRIIWPMRAVISSLEPKIRRFGKKDLAVYFGDLVDHMDKVWDTLEECKEVIEVFKDTDYVLSTEHLNEILKVLTVLSTVSLPFILVSSIFGMNVNVPGGVTSGNLTSFILIILVMLFISGCMLHFFRRRRWI